MPRNHKDKKLFHRYFTYGVGIIQLALGGSAQDAYKKIVKKHSYFTENIAHQWTYKTTPNDSKGVEALSSFAMLCLQSSDQLNRQYNGVEPIVPEWVRALFDSAGFSVMEMTEELQSELKLRTLKKKTADFVGSDFTAALEEYKHAVIDWAGQVQLTSRLGYRLATGFIHSRLQDLGVLGQVAEPTQAANLLLEEKVRAEIVAPTGYGKSILWRYLAYLAAKKADTFPIVIDWSEVADAQSVEAIISASIARVWLNVPGELRDNFVSVVVEELKQGTAFALIDNWNSAVHVDSKIIDAIARWRRVIFFRNSSASGRAHAHVTYSLPKLDELEAREFIEKWPVATETQLTVYRVLPYLNFWEPLNEVTRIPILLDLLCKVLAEGPELDGIGQWRFIKNAIQLLTDEVRGEGITPGQLTAALGDLALAAYRRKGGLGRRAYSFGYRKVTRYLEHHPAWRNNAQVIIEIAVTSGILRRWNDEICFIDPLFQAALAATTLVDTSRDNADWRTQVESIRFNPRWTEVITFSAARLEEFEDAPERGLTIFFEALLANGQTDPIGLIWHLAGKCFAMLRPVTRQQLNNQFGRLIQENVLNNMKELRCSGLDIHDYKEILLGGKTDSLAGLLITLIRQTSRESPY